MNKLIEIKGHESFLISNNGLFYAINSNKKHRIIYPFETKAGLKIKLTNNVSYFVYNIILENFYPEWNGIDLFKYKTKGLIIHPNSFTFTKSKIIDTISIEENEKYIAFRCKERAVSNNSRCTYKITGFDVFNCLLSHDFKCHYCNNTLNNKDWNLDHFYPLSRGGKNKNTNIVPSCRRCNMMKGDLNGYDFINKCKEISLANNDYESVIIESKKQTHVLPKISKTTQKLKNQIINYSHKIIKENGKDTF